LGAAIAGDGIASVTDWTVLRRDVERAHIQRPPALYGMEKLKLTISRKPTGRKHSP
jgi:hypothetical protein